MLLSARACTPVASACAPEASWLMPCCRRAMLVALSAGSPRVPRACCRVGMGVWASVVVAVTVEIAANPYGMGYAMSLAQQSLDPAGMLAWLLWIGVVGYGLNAATLRLQLAVARRMGAMPDAATTGAAPAFVAAASAAGNVRAQAAERRA